MKQSNNHTDVAIFLAAILVLSTIFILSIYEPTGLVVLKDQIKINEKVEDPHDIIFNTTLSLSKDGEIIYNNTEEEHNIEVDKGDYDITIKPVEKISVKEIKIKKQVKKDINQIVDIDEIPESGTEYSQVYAVEPIIEKDFDLSITVDATGNELFKCEDWDFEDRECLGEWEKILDTTPGQTYTVDVDCGFKEEGGCKCNGIRSITLESDYSFSQSTDYTVTAEVFKGSGTNPSQLIDEETVNFNTLPQNNIDDNSGTTRGNLIIEKINQSSIVIRFHNTTNERLLGDNTFRITVDSTTLGPDTVHLSCSEPIDIGDNFGDFEVVDIDKIISGSDCEFPILNLISPPNNSNTSNNVTFAYNVYDDDQSISFCELIINGTVYQTDYSIQEIIPQYFNQNLSNGTYIWNVNCTTSNGYEVESDKWILNVGVAYQNNIKGEITDSNYNPVTSSVKVYNSNGQLVLSDDEIYDFNLPTGRYNVQVIPSTGNLNELYIYNLTVNEDIINFTRIEDSLENISRPDFLENITEAVSWLINPLADFDAVMINISYGYGTDLALWKCTDFDFDDQECNDENNWTYLKDIPDGPNTIVFYLNSSDPIVLVSPSDKPPEVTLNSPANNFVGYTNTTYNLKFNCTAEDNQGTNKGITNISLYLTDNANSNFSLNQTITYSGNNKTETAVFNKTLEIGNYTWNCLAYDKGGNFDWGTNRSLKIIYFQQANQTVCCCGLSVSTTPEVVGQNEKVLVTADVSNLLTGLAALSSEITSINTTIYRIDNGTEITIINNTPMTFLNNGLWYYEFFVGNNTQGTYVAYVTMVTNQTVPFVKEASNSFTVGEKISGLTITGISPDLVNLNQTVRLAAEIKYNGIAVDSSLISNASLFIDMINGSNQTYTSALTVDDGLVYIDGSFNETGVYYLDWTASYLGQTRTAREISVVVSWEDLLQDINYTINVELITLIKETRQYLLQLLTDMEYMQEFTEEEIFLITDSVNSMTEIVNYLEKGEINNDQAEQQFNSIKKELMNKLGYKLTGSFIGADIESIENTQSPITKILNSLKDWRVVMFVMLLFMFAAMMFILLTLIRILQTGILSKNKQIPNPVKPKKPEIKTKKPESKPIQPKKQEQNQGKRRYQIIIEKIRKKLKERKENKKKEQNSKKINLDRKFYKE